MKSKKLRRKFIAQQEALEDVKSIAWGDEVLKHGKKITVSGVLETKLLLSDPELMGDKQKLLSQCIRDIEKIW